MKKILILFIAVFALCSSSSYSQNMFEYNKTIEFGIHFGAVDQHNGAHMGFQTLMANVAIYGVYLDVGGWAPAHGRDVNVGKWDDEKCFAFHGGYQIPIARWLKITPMIGYYNHQYGHTNGWDWTVDNHGIKNKFNASWKSVGFDYGGQIQFNIKCSDNINFNIMGTLTKNMWYGGLGIGINLSGKNKNTVTTNSYTTSYRTTYIPRYRYSRYSRYPRYRRF